MLTDSSVVGGAQRLPAAELQPVLDKIGGLSGPPLTLSEVAGLLRSQPWAATGAPLSSEWGVAEPLLQGLEAASYSGRSGSLHAWGGGVSLPQLGDTQRLPATEFLHAAVGRPLRLALQSTVVSSLPPAPATATPGDRAGPVLAAMGTVMQHQRELDAGAGR